MAEMDERFQQILSWQQMDQNKAISQILQEVSPGPGREGGGTGGVEHQNSTVSPGQSIRTPQGAPS